MSGGSVDREYACGGDSSTGRPRARSMEVSMRHLVPPCRRRFWCLPPLLVALFTVLAASAALAQAPSTPPAPPPTVFTYHDSDGQGRLTLTDVGPDEATGGRQIKIGLTQNGLSYYGSGFTLPLETTPPYKTLISFTLVSARTGNSFHFAGTTISGITLSGSGTYHRAGVPERKANWSIVLGG